MEQTNALDKAGFQSIWDELYRRNLDLADYCKAMNELMPDESTKDSFRFWALSRAVPHLTHPEKIMTPAQLVNRIDSINFFNEDEHERLLTEGLRAHVRPWVPLGKIGNHLYRLAPSPAGLRAQREEDKQNPNLLPACYLGVNTTVQPQQPELPLSRRATNLSAQSDMSAESDDADAPGFIFHQLGALEYIEADSEDELPTSLGEADDWDWERTCFMVVARLGPFGRASGIYVIFDMFPRQLDDLGGDYGRGPRVQITHGNWGIPPSCKGEQFSCARIGDMMAKFGFEHQLDWTEKIEHPVELVRVARIMHGVAT
ncbi:hypothetical protein GGR54DRAFT_89515 [Hypoxylon sp. NC1633]|nr:hypothetical protein GGR54DRAFT_89515 [Hypoxylon sp. NC1633]